MEREQAEAVAAEYLNLESGPGTEDRVDRLRQIRDLAATIETTVPDVDPENGWAVISLHPVLGEGDAELAALALAGDCLFRFKIERREEGSIVGVLRIPSDEWRIFSVADGLTPDAGALLVKRGWGLELEGEENMFRTDHYVGQPPDRIERFGRALAAADGWEVGDLQIPDDAP